MKLSLVAGGLVAATCLANAAQADKLDDIIASAWQWHSAHPDGFGRG